MLKICIRLLLPIMISEHVQFHLVLISFSIRMEPSIKGQCSETSMVANVGCTTAPPCRLPRLVKYFHMLCAPSILRCTRGTKTAPRRSQLVSTIELKAFPQVDPSSTKQK